VESAKGETVKKNIEPFYRIPPEVAEDLKLYRNEVERFNRGEVTPEKLRPFREHNKCL